MKRKLILVALSVSFILMASKAYACMMGGPEDRPSVVKEYLQSLKESDTLFIGVVVDLDYEPVKSNFPGMGKSTPTYKVIKPLQNSVEHDFVEGRTTTSSSCLGGWEPDAGDVVLYTKGENGEKVFALALHQRKMDWYFLRNAQTIQEKYGYDVKSEIGAISDLADQAANKARDLAEKRRSGSGGYKNWLLYGSPLALLAGLYLARRLKKAPIKGAGVN